jgi:protein-S-isoprenylcysteine O-methyltransferase Ste14
MQQLEKGLDQLRKHIPDLNTPLGILRHFLFPAILLFLIAVFFNAIRFASPLWEMVTEIFLAGLGFGLLYLFFRYKQDFKTRFGPLAYSRAARWLGFPGVLIIATAIGHIRSLPGPEITLFEWHIVLTVLGWVLVVLGTLLGVRTILVFGVDNLTMLYVYFPEESRLVNQKIYDIMRHPAYAAVLLIAMGLALLNGGWIAIICALIFVLGLWTWVRLVEEQELIRRFGPSYAEYRQRVPAFWPRLGGLKGFFSFLILGK